MAEIDKIDTTDNGYTPNQENSCPSSSSETSIAPSTSDESIEKNVSSCSNDNGETQTSASTVDENVKNSDRPTVEIVPNEMESQQLPSSSTEETDTIACIDNKFVEKAANLDDTLTDTQCATDSKMNNKEETVDCVVDSSDVINKCDLMTTEDVPAAGEATPVGRSAQETNGPEENSESEIKCESESDAKVDNKIATEVQVEVDVEHKSKIESKIELNETPSIPEIDTKPDSESAPAKESTADPEINRCNASSSNLESDTKCIEEHCDSVDFVNKEDIEPISNVQNDEIIASNVDDGAKTDQLDSEFEQIDDNVPVDEQKAIANGSNDCDSSDILVENKVDAEGNGAISANNTSLSEEVNESNESSNECEQNVEPSDLKTSETCKREQEQDQQQDVEPIQAHVQNEQLPSASSTDKNDVQARMDIDPETRAKEANACETVCETASSRSTKLNCNNSMLNEATTNSETKCAYDLNECVSSPEITPIGFKDKFKKSLEIMEKSKQELISIDKIDKINEQLKITADADAKTSDHQHQANAAISTDNNSTNQVIRNDKNDSYTSAQIQNANETATATNDVCKEETKKPETAEANSVQATVETVVNHENTTIPSQSTMHSTLDSSDHNDSRERQTKPPTPTETRTIIISPQNRGQLGLPRSMNDDSKSVASADSLSSKTGSLYVNNPDFSKSLHTSLRDLSELRMKPPDFSKLSRSSELHVPNPDFTRVYDKLHDTHSRRASPLLDINPNNFAEISKKYNFISDLQLKNPSATAAIANEPTQSTCSSLYVRPPDFTSKLRIQVENVPEIIEEPTPHIIHKHLYRPNSSEGSSKASAVARSTPTHTEYSHVSEDVTMSLVQTAPQAKVQTQTKLQVPPKAPTPVQRVDSRSASNAPPASHIYSPMPLERPNSQTYEHPLSVHQQKIYNDELYQQNPAASSAHHHYSAPAHVFHHRDVPTAPTQKIHHAHEQYASTEKAPMPRGIQTSLEANMKRPTNDTLIYSRPASTSMLYHEQNRLKPIHSATLEMQPSNNSHMNTYNYPMGRPASAHNLNKPSDYYNQMNSPQKWPSQTRITQSPISSAPSPHSISSQNIHISQSQSPVSASPLPYQMHRQSPSNLQYQSPHTTPSPSPFGYSSSPVPVKPNKLPTNTPVNNIPPLKKHNDYALPVANSTDKKQLTNHLVDPKAKLKENSRHKEMAHDSRDQYQQMPPTHHRSSSSNRNMTKTDAKYPDRMDYKRPNTILDPYVFRQASDTDVNYQIIKKTLNKEIPTPSFNRKNADLNASLVLSSPRMNTHAYQPQIPNDLNAKKDKCPTESRLVYLDSKQPHEIYQDKMAKQNELNKMQYPLHSPYHPGRSIENHIGFESRATNSASMSNHQFAGPAINHQLPVGVSQQQKPTNQLTSSGVEPIHVPYEPSPPVRPKIEPRKEKPTPPPVQQQPQQQQQQQQQQQRQQPNNLSVNDVSSSRPASSSLFVQTKRESPLDLSVKTVKTKADSTGVYDYSLPSRRHDIIPQSLKVDFAPNFTNSSPDPNQLRGNANYRSQSRSETLPVPSTMINNIMSNHTQISLQPSQSPMPQQSSMPQPPTIPMEIHQRYVHNNSQYNIDAATRYKDTACVPPKLNSRNTTTAPVAPASVPTSAPAESKSRKDMKLPLIFGQKPEDLKNIKPDVRAFQTELNNKHAMEGTSVASFNKAPVNNTMDKPPVPKNNPKEREFAYRGHNHPHPLHGYPSNPMAHGEYPHPNERPSEVIQFVSHSSPQSVNRLPETTMTDQQRPPVPYSHYNHFDPMHRNQSQPAYNTEYAVSNKTVDERYKTGHPYMERNDAMYSAMGNVSQKRPLENGLIDQIPSKQPRYDMDDIKYQQSVNNRPYYPHAERNMAMYAPHTKVNEKAISTPVIVQPQHAIANEAKYHYHPYPNMSNENKHALPMRPNENFEPTVSKVNAQQFRPPQYYPHYAPGDKPTPYEDVTKPKAQINASNTHQPHNNIYSQPYQRSEWPTKIGNNEHPIGYGARIPYDHHPPQPNSRESSVIKTADFSKTEVIVTEPFRTNAMNNNTNSTSNNNNIIVPKAVDQSVISKLRNNLELKEIEKQKLLKTQSIAEKAAEEVNKSDLASILAARIRTKGELKGFTPVPVNDTVNSTKEKSSAVVKSIETEKIVPKSEVKLNDGLAGLDLMDWGSTCNDFLEQLQNNGEKQRSRAQRRFKMFDADHQKDKVEVKENASKVVEKLYVEEEKSSEPKSNSQNNDETSSDEDKPLLFLRQQSLNENSKNRKNASSDDREKTSPHQKKNSLKKQSPSKHIDNKKRLAIESSSESEEESDRFSKRSKKLIRKPRTRSCVSNRDNDDDEDSDTTSVCTSNNNEKSSKKRNRNEKSSSESDVDDNKNSKKRKSLESSKINSYSDDDDDTTLSNSTKKKSQPTKIEETMTRSKRKRELELEIANSKVLRNDKMVKCNSITLEKRGSDAKLTPEKKSNSNISDSMEKSCTKNTEKSQRSKSTDLKKKANDSDAEETSKKPSFLKKNLRNRQQSSSSENESSSSSSDNETITERLRSRKSKTNNLEAQKEFKGEKSKAGCSHSIGESIDEKPSKKKSNKNTPKKSVADLDISEDSRSQFPSGWGGNWEEQAYEYKRSLKIPARLITIGRPSWHQHRKSTSLPDLDPHHSSDASETFAEINKKSAAVSSIKKNISSDKKTGDLTSMNHDSDNAASDLKSKSIIDLLHQRVIRPTVKSKKPRNQVVQNEPKKLPRSNELELLPTPGSEGKPENAFKSENVFETAVLKSRTRKEYKAMKTQEIIREVFGGEDRPASAPPYNFELLQQKLQAQLAQPLDATHQQEKQDSKPLTFDQQYQEYLEKLNVDYGEKIRKVKSINEARNSIAESGKLIPKVEKMDEDTLEFNQDEDSHDIELNECEHNIDGIKEEACDSLERGDTPSVMSEADRTTPTSFAGVLKTKKGRGNRYGRRKGSSGFDYIRKKKKPLSQQNNSQGSLVVVKRRSAAVNYLEFKNEDDITREIRSWVLNKGVGESVLHKAARLGYIDVIVYCLERLDMLPDQKDNAGYTPLHEACSRGLTDIARVLLQYGANHSETAHSGIRPLHEAVDNGYLEIVRLLLSYGADPLLATYAGQTPIMLAEDDDEMVSFLKNHLIDVQNTGPNKMPWKFEGSWRLNDPDNNGFDVFDDVPVENDPVQKPAKIAQEACTSTTPEKVIKPPKRKSPLRRKSKQTEVVDAGELSETHNGDSDAELFEIEESDSPLIPLYQLRDEGATKWVLLSDLCYLLKVKSKDTLLKLLYPGSSPTASANQKDLLRELKMSEFLEKAICLQLLCAGEKLNIRSSKVTLVVYNENVKNALGVKTIKMRL